MTRYVGLAAPTRRAAGRSSPSSSRSPRASTSAATKSKKKEKADPTIPEEAATAVVPTGATETSGGVTSSFLDVARDETQDRLEKQYFVLPRNERLGRAMHQRVDEMLTIEDEASRRYRLLVRMKERALALEKSKETVEKSSFDVYKKRLDTAARRDMIKVGDLGVDDAEEALEWIDERIEEQEEAEEQLLRERTADFVDRVRQARENMALYRADLRREIDSKSAYTSKNYIKSVRRFQRAFRRFEDRLRRQLSRDKGVLYTSYGRLEDRITDHDIESGQGNWNKTYGGIEGRRYRVEVERSPQPIRINFLMMRSVGEKLPTSHYSLLVTLFDRLGGQPLAWTKLNMQGKWRACTEPFEHYGTWHNVDMRIDRDTFLPLPPTESMRPSMVYVFELFKLRRASEVYDKVVGWGAFPAFDLNFEPVNGRFRTPLLRGTKNTRIQRWEQIDKLVGEKHQYYWLCNLYFEVERLPKVRSSHGHGVHVYDSELGYEAKGVGFRKIDERAGEELEMRKRNRIDWLKIREHFGDSFEKYLPGYSSDEDEDFNDSFSEASGEEPGDSGEEDSDQDESDQEGKGDIENGLGDKRKSTQRNIVTESGIGLLQVAGARMVAATPEPPDDADRASQPPRDDADSDAVQVSDTVSSSTENDQVEAETVEMAEARIKGIRGFDEFDLSVISDQDVGLVEKRWAFVAREMLYESGLHNYRSKSFRRSVAFMLLCFWLLYYAHYTGVWIFVASNDQPVDSISVNWHEMTVDYVRANAPTNIEFGSTLAGPVFLVICYSGLVFIFWLVQRMFGNRAYWMSKTMLLTGIMVLLDPITVFIRNAMNGNVNDSDLLALKNNFERDGQSGSLGIIYTLVLYLLAMFLQGVVLVFYFMKIHNYGMEMDSYNRLRADAQYFLLPYDQQVPERDLHRILEAANDWLGRNGARRRVVLTKLRKPTEMMSDYFATLLDLPRETMTHVQIYTVYPDGRERMYRHFLHFPFRGIVYEVIGQIPEDDTDFRSRASMNPINRARQKLMMKRARSLSSDEGLSDDVAVLSDDSVTAAGTSGAKKGEDADDDDDSHTPTATEDMTENASDHGSDHGAETAPQDVEQGDGEAIKEPEADASADAASQASDSSSKKAVPPAEERPEL